MNIAIAHDAYTSDGGAERVAATLARLFDAPLYCTVIDDEAVPDDVDSREVWDSRTAKWFNERSWYVPRTAYWISRHLYRRQRATYAPELTEYDTVIQTKGPQWPYVPQPHQTVIRYVHSPPRRHYDHFHKNGGSFPSRMWSMMHRMMDGPAIRYPDYWICNSDVVGRRTQQYYDIPDAKASVVYPPVGMPEDVPSGDGGYYLYLGRLAHNKRIDLVCDIARETDHEVVIAGTGPERDTVEGIDVPNLTYHGYVDESHKWELLSKARATLFFAEDEDFGIVPIESMATGTPVIGVREGFTQYQIQDGHNGYLTKPTVENTSGAIERFERDGVAWDPDRIRAYAEQFGRERFNDEMQSIVTAVRDESTIDPKVKVPVGVTA